ncbi:hypothetical protein KRX56_00300 [Dermabacteraceae bacterium TAE3-ERU27]|nr:hypothetical protein [Dermabacteraceae bacterium TAE3-ERU27]
MQGVRGKEHKNNLALSPTGEKTLRTLSDNAHSLFGSIMILDFVAGLLIVGDGYPIPGLGVPVSMISLGMICLLGVIRGAKNTTGVYFVAFAAVVFGVFWTTIVSLSLDVPYVELGKRVVRILAVVVGAIFIAERRVDPVSLIKGLMAGLMLNVALFYSHLAPDFYGGALTGYLGDKNKAGLYYFVGGLAAMAVSKKPKHTVIIFVFTAAMVWLTGSRTTLAGLLVASLWTYLATKMGKPLRYMFGILLVLMVRFIEANFSRVGVFTNRLGSDLLRERIDRASLIKLNGSPFEGRGFGQAYVMLDGKSWYFHNAYWTLQVEGGLVYFILVVGATLLVGLGVFRNTPYTLPLRKAEGALAGLFVAAWKLGEVMLTNAWMLVVGLLVLYILESSNKLQESSTLKS